MSLLDDFVRVTRSLPCPVCEHVDWCLVSREQPPVAAICSRVESRRRWKEAGWFHRLRDDGCRSLRTVRIMRTIERPPCTVRIDAMCREFQAATTSEEVDDLATRLGLSGVSLRRLGVGVTNRVWAFPMQHPSRLGTVCGIRYRTPGGTKFSERGGKEGLFVPTELSWDGPLLLPEGPTDTAAALDMALDAVGRPSCCGGVKLVQSLVATMRPPSVVVVADSDEPGQRGAALLANALVTVNRDVRVILPPVKDLREWYRDGATRFDVLQLIEQAEPLQLAVNCKGVRRG